MKQNSFPAKKIVSNFFMKQDLLQIVIPSSTIAAGADSDSADKWCKGLTGLFFGLSYTLPAMNRLSR